MENAGGMTSSYPRRMGLDFYPAAEKHRTQNSKLKTKTIFPNLS
jgi:hypothetical protein